MGGGSSVQNSFIGRLQTKSMKRVASKLMLTSVSVTQKLGWNKENRPPKSKDNNAASPDAKLLLIRQLLVEENIHCASFLKLIELNGNKVFLEKCEILEEMERKVFRRMFFVNGDSDDYHQLDNIIPLKDLFAVDSTSPPAVHIVFDKLYKFIYNYRASYVRWMGILNMLQDELLLQIVNDYDEFIVCQAKTPQKTPKNTRRTVSSASVSDEVTHQHIMQYPYPSLDGYSRNPTTKWGEIIP